MAGDYAHEFRTPLTSLQSNLEGMIDGIFEVTPERLESCREEILRLTRMISDIDKIVELESDSLVLHKENFDFTKLLNQVLTNFERQIFDKHIVLSVTASPLAIYADKDKISQVLVNLISNAIKYTGIDGKIYIEISDEKDSVKFSITDNGIGIAPDDLPNIFEHLYRADLSRARYTGGSGIGLSVAKAIITAHGGIITAESELNKGSKFTFVIKK
jgi:signal transduction histidine kinase